MKILVTGASGKLGNRILELGKDYEIYGTFFSHSIPPNLFQLDIRNYQQVLKLLNKIKPDVVIHTAAMTNTDKCEDNILQAWLTNTSGTLYIAKACKKIGSKLIYISTDYVFDGEKGNYNESDITNPINIYGITKRVGELECMRILKDFLILRTSNLYGWFPRFKENNFITFLLNSLKQNKKLDVVEDLFYTPTYINNLAEIIFEAIERDLHGLYHATGCEAISRYDFARRIATMFELNPNLINPIKMIDATWWKTPRPKNTSLDTHLIAKKLKTKLLNIDEGLEKVRDETR